MLNVYAETNFVLELALEQEEYDTCEQILTLCQTEQATLCLPAYSLAEPYETIGRRDELRKRISETLRPEMRQLSRSRLNRQLVMTLLPALTLLTTAGKVERQHLNDVQARMTQTAVILPLDGVTLERAAQAQRAAALRPQDAMVYASVLQHLQSASFQNACFLTRNGRDFDIPAIKAELAALNCRLITSFPDGLTYIRSQVQS